VVISFAIQYCSWISVLLYIKHSCGGCDVAACDVIACDVTARDVAARDVAARDVTARDVTSKSIMLVPDKEECV
jgi:hypothetical protein